MHLTWRFGSPDSQFERWLMIVSMAIAVLPVCRSPMISSRWPRPIGVIASIGLIPVCSGSLTFWRCTTDGACSSSARSSVVSIGPLPSSGLASGSTTRPRKPSPTGTDRTSPVRLTRWPESILLYSPRMTTPISRTLRFSARPRVPSSNSSSSLAMADGSPSTRAMPSPASATMPISWVAVPAGSYASTKRASASRISSGRIVSSAIVLASFSSGGQPAPEPGQPARHAAVDKLARDLDGHAADDPGVDHYVQVYVVAVARGQGRREPAPLRRGQRDRDVHLGHQALPPLRGQAGVLVQARIQATSPGLVRGLRDQPQRRAGHLAAQQRVEQLVLAVGRDERAGQRGPELRLGVHDPAEPEQLVLDVVQLVLPLGDLDDRERAELLGRVGDVRWLRPAQADQATDQPQRLGRDPRREQVPGQGRLGPGLPGRIGQHPAQRGMGVQQPCHGEQLVAQPTEVGAAGDDRGELLLGLGERGPAGPSHCASSSLTGPSPAWRCSRTPARAARGTGPRSRAAWSRPRATRRRPGWPAPRRGFRPRPAARSAPAASGPRSGPRRPPPAGRTRPGLAAAARRRSARPAPWPPRGAARPRAALR